ncbi:DUF7563 family protein [Halogranum amylolyticum]
MPTCQNCRANVSKQYVRVFTPDNLDNPRACPHCQDMVRAGASVRKTRSTR